MLDTPAFYTYKTGYVDRGMTLAPRPSWPRSTARSVTSRPAASSRRLSIKFFGTDYVTAAATFDLAGVGQTVP